MMQPFSQNLAYFMLYDPLKSQALGEGQSHEKVEHVSPKMDDLTKRNLGQPLTSSPNRCLDFVGDEIEDEAPFRSKHSDFGNSPSFECVHFPRSLRQN
jgi:hypothetical protein